LSPKGEIRALLAAPLCLRAVGLVSKVASHSFPVVSIPIPAFGWEPLQ